MGMKASNLYYYKNMKKTNPVMAILWRDASYTNNDRDDNH
jgi:hypothetical protein